MGPFQENSFIAWQKGLVPCLVIDPGDEPGLIQNAIEEEDLEPVAIINTHAHLDHIGAVTELKKEFGIPFYLHKEEKFVLNNFERDRAFFGMVSQGVPFGSLPGIICKIFIYNFDTNTFGGFYFWDSETAMHDYVDGKEESLVHFGEEKIYVKGWISTREDLINQRFETYLIK